MMKEEFLFRKLKKEEVSSVVELVRNSFNPLYLIPSIYRPKGIDSFILLELENKYSPYEYFVMIGLDNKIIAFAEFKNYGNTAFLNLVATAKSYKKSGAANLLFEYCRKYFWQKGIKSIELDVFESNTVAVDWYKKLGFMEIEKQFLYKNLQNLDSSINHEDIQLLNFPQFSSINKLFGFSFLELNFKEEYYKVGVIGNIFMVRNTYSKSLIAGLLYIGHYMEIDDIYFILKDENIAELSMIDSIFRMKL